MRTLKQASLAVVLILAFSAGTMAGILETPPAPEPPPPSQGITDTPPSETVTVTDPVELALGIILQSVVTVF